ncbi:PhnD/SsuA/transferrin family substrate-binding protein [Rhodoferax sp.]|uniref:sensor histidine kinase n=1 Tax=Rhodoferax sp. TaxID=50421 RepID=UPI0028403618|nr:PhnD/SsuA/transferrin family substrate-binding protein [Rhodoferax sp.]MDR3367612.1 PhnD/SsuA/transferrin family substrate-binding protein [Rhodoferax sp.]
MDRHLSISVYAFFRGYHHKMCCLPSSAPTGRVNSFASALMALAGLFFGFQTPALAKEVVIGVFAYQGEQVATSDWSPMLNYLNAALPSDQFQLASFDAQGLRAAIAQHHVDLVITNPGYYVAMEYEFGLSRIATLATHQALSTSKAIGSAVIVRADRHDMKELSDLAGKRMAAVAPQAFGGYLVVAREMLHQGVDPESDLTEVRFMGLPMTNIFAAVQSGAVDAGIVRACLLEQLNPQGALKRSDFKVLSPRHEPGFACALSTPLYPDWPIAVTRTTDRTLAKRVAQALLNMPETPSGLSWSVPTDYQTVHDLYRELRIEPYAYLRESTPKALLLRFWPWLLGLALLLVAWGIHTVRVEQLVQRRTAQLRDSLDAREAAEARMRDHQEQMEHLSRLSILGELSGNLAHEINQPLTTIGNYARSVLRRQADGRLTPEAVQEACNEINNEAERAGGIVRRIRHFARKRSAVRESTQVPQLAQEARRLILGMLRHPPTITIDDQSLPQAQVMADGPQIQQVLLNLIKNAIDAGRDLPLERQAILLRLETTDNRLLVQVIDQGCGLSEANLSRLFEPFFTTKPDGLGLGLPICKTIIEAHGGRLWAELNQPGPGMRFLFTLPSHVTTA